MAKVSLRNYNREIEGFIEHGQLDEAIAHCRHILKTFPKHLETYRLLGKAYLEAKRYKEALDIFQRVLMSVPDDFVSHVGMSIIYDDQNKLDESIWHMERAFEVQPSNGAIQGELQRLFGRRDGVEPPKIRLTRGALAHMYVQGELYAQAISEIRAVLNNDAQRNDMQVLLAKAYFRGGQKAEATEICSQLLKRYPYCLDANRILVEILPGTQRAESAQTYQQRVNELDPYAAYAQDSIFRSEEVADGLVSLDRLEYSGQAVDMGANWAGVKGIGLPSEIGAAGPMPTQPEWLKAAAPASTPPAGQAIPDFLRQAGWTESSGEPAAESALPESAGEEESAEGSAVQADLPDWIKAMAPADEAASVPPSISTDIPDWLKTEAGNPPAAASQPSSPASAAPDWLKTTGEPKSAEPEQQDEEPLTDTGWLRGLGSKEPPPPIPESEEPLSDTGWLRRLGEEQSAQPAPSTELPQEETPDWLKGLDNDLIVPFSTTGAGGAEKFIPPASSQPESPVPIQQQVEPVPPAASGPSPAPAMGNLGTTAQEQDDAMAWLESLAAKHGAKPEELVTDPNARTEVAPEWVDKAKEIGKQAPPEPAGAPTMDVTGAWLHDLNLPTTGKFDEHGELQIPSSPQTAPDWLSGLSGKDAFKGISEEEEEKEESSIIGSQETPAWLSDLGSKAVPPSTPTPESKDVPDWLQENATQPLVSEENMPQTTRFTEAGSEAANTAELPDWLASLDKEAAPPKKPTTGELPGWLVNEGQPQVTERTQAADWQPVEPEPEEPQIEPEPVTSMEPPAAVVEPPEKVSPVPPAVEQEPTRPVKKPAPPPARPKPVVTPSKVIDVSLDGAQAEMGHGNIGAALEMYNRMIRKGRSLEEIIRDLRDALYRYPVEVPIWQALGDAYMRANRLQEALDAYTKAEELLR